MPTIEELIDEKKIQKLTKLLNITLVDLKDRIQQIKPFTKDKFLEEMGLNGKDDQDIFSDQELCKNKEIWVDSVDEAIKQQPKEQDSAAVITSNGAFIMQVCGEDQDKTIRSITQAYHDVTGQLIQHKYYKSQEEFLAAAENQNLAENVKQAVCNAGFPLTVYTLKFDSEQKYQDFERKIKDLIKNGKLTSFPLVSNPADIQKSTPTLKPTSSLQPTSTSEEEKSSETLSAKSSPTPFKKMLVPPEPKQIPKLNTSQQTDSSRIKQQAGPSATPTFT